MVKVLTLGIVGTVLGILAGILYFILAVVSPPQQLATAGFSVTLLYGAGIAAIIFSFIGLCGALLGEKGLPSFLLSIQYSYLIREKTIAIVLLIIGAIGIFFTGSIYGLPSTILFIIAAVMIWRRRKEETSLEQETDEGEQEMDTVTY